MRGPPAGTHGQRTTLKLAAAGVDPAPLDDGPLPGPHNTGASAALHSHPVSVDEAADAGQPRQHFDDDFDLDVDAGVETAESAGDATVSISSSAQDQQQGVVAQPPQGFSPSSLLARVPGGAPGRLAALGIVGFVGITGVIALVRAVLKFRTPRAKKIRTVNKNKAVVEAISRFLPDSRQSFTRGEAQSLKIRTGFSGVEVFRKYLWYLLRERSFDNDALADMVHLKDVLRLSDSEVIDALKERSERIYKDYGNVMLDTEGMTKAGVEKKATCRALFSKLLYLAESEELLPEASGEARRSAVADVFGATEDDSAALRIVSLYEVDAGRVDELASEPDGPLNQPPAALGSDDE